jgi:osmotically-inducible protein OsmY
MTMTKRFTSGFASAFLALFLLSMAGCASTPTQNGPGGYIDDTVITTKVKAAIVKEPNLKASEINVETFKGTVQLSGFVATQEAAARAGTVAREVEGVKAVKNDIRLK